MRTIAFLICAIVFIVAPRFATAQSSQQPAPQRIGTSTLGLTTLQPPKLVKPQPFVFRLQVPTLQPKPDASKPAVVCGTTLVPADPTFDAGMRRTVPDVSSMTNFTIKSVQPTICTRTGQ